jgi:anaerobic selenocysteine-containing dehydrogenase
MSAGFSPPLRVMDFISTRRGDADRGPEVRMRADEAAIRVLVDGELVRVETPRRQEIATLRVDNDIPRGEVVVRDIAGVSPSEIVRVRKIDLDSPPRHFA